MDANVKHLDAHIYLVTLHRVSKKTVQNCFCQNFVKFPPMLIIFGRKMAKRLKLCEVHSFSNFAQFFWDMVYCITNTTIHLLRVLICRLWHIVVPTVKAFLQVLHCRITAHILHCKIIGVNEMQILDKCYFILITKTEKNWYQNAISFDKNQLIVATENNNKYYTNTTDQYKAK